MKSPRLAIEAVAALSFLLLPLIVVPALAPSTGVHPLPAVLWGTLLIHLCIVCYYFLISYIGLPRFHFKGKRAAYVGMTAGAFAVTLLVAFSDGAFNPFTNSPTPYPVTLFFLSILARFIVATVVGVAVASYVRLKKAEDERLRSELAFLRAQVNPHFLFNTLNSIYALTVVRSEKAQQAITQLAAIMRYVLDKAQADRVPLAEELDSLRAYVELEKLRLNDQAKVTFVIDGDTGGKQVTPLLLLPLVENAFKHGVNTEAPSEIAIRATVTDEELAVEIVNTKNTARSAVSGGVGMNNLRRRLAMLPGSNRLEVVENESTFTARLRLSLT